MSPGEADFNKLYTPGSKESWGVGSMDRHTKMMHRAYFHFSVQWSRVSCHNELMNSVHCKLCRTLILKLQHNIIV